ncbi:hypothetical protein [Massilia sp. YMA4]|uniref:hypothetical protein n=1 Tax=Massilia sp. YMA4 TaxID=1593482 RepID=UPI0015834AD9|nr:hypothetical protein [Massilia sp. YMA4]
MPLLIGIEFDEEPLGAGGEPASAFRMNVECRDGHAPSDFECFEVLRLISDSRFQARVGKEKNPPVQRRVVPSRADIDPTSGLRDAEYVVRPERDDGNPLVQGEFDAMLLTYVMRMNSEFARAEPEMVPTIMTNPAVYPLLLKMPRKCSIAWYAAMSQLEPDDERHVVQIEDTKAAQPLIEAGLLSLTSAPTAFVVNKNFAHCTYAEAASNDSGLSTPDVHE